MRRPTLILAAFLAAGLLSGPARPQEVSEYGNPLTRLTVKGVPVLAEVVRTPEKLYLGLSFRPGLAAGRGMLFLLPRKEVQEFCMRDMRFAIDILWIDDGKVVGLHRRLSPSDPGGFQSPAPVHLVLEVPGGFADRHGIKEGDPVRLELPGGTD